jgi:hypothetical protein
MGSNLNEGSILPKHMSRSLKANHGSKNHLGPIGTIVSKLI